MLSGVTIVCAIENWPFKLKAKVHVVVMIGCHNR